MTWKVKECRNQNDFKYGSFTVYVTPKAVIIRGTQKRTNSSGLYMELVKHD